MDRDVADEWISNWRGGGGLGQLIMKKLVIFFEAFRSEKRYAGATYVAFELLIF